MSEQFTCQHCGSVRWPGDPHAFQCPNWWSGDLLPKIRKVARALGYAIAVHGSEVRDYDLIAVPWLPDAKPARELVDAIKDAVGGYFQTYAPAPEVSGRAEVKPHNRLAWSIYLHHDGERQRYIDLSVIAQASDVYFAHTWEVYAAKAAGKHSADQEVARLTAENAELRERVATLSLALEDTERGDDA